MAYPFSISFSSFFTLIAVLSVEAMERMSKKILRMNIDGQKISFITSVLFVRQLSDGI